MPVPAAARECRVDSAMRGTMIPSRDCRRASKQNSIKRAGVIEADKGAGVSTERRDRAKVIEAVRDGLKQPEAPCLSLNPPSVQYCTDICRREFYSYRIESHLRIVIFSIFVSLNRMNLHDHRLAAILQIRTALAARMFELRDLRRRVQTAQQNPRRRRRARSKTAFFKSLDAESISWPQRVGLAKWRAQCGRRLRPRLK
jgi:hypothetical protein